MTTVDLYNAVFVSRLKKMVNDFEIKKPKILVPLRTMLLLPRNEYNGNFYNIMPLLHDKNPAMVEICDEFSRQVSTFPSL